MDTLFSLEHPQNYLAGFKKHFLISFVQMAKCSSPCKLLTLTHLWFISSVTAVLRKSSGEPKIVNPRKSYFLENDAGHVPKLNRTTWNFRLFFYEKQFDEMYLLYEVILWYSIWIFCF